MPRLENWSLVMTENNPYQAPELATVQLSGEVYGHDRFDDGVRVTTSRVVYLNIKDRFANTLNTKYELGEVSEDYLKWLDNNGYKLNSEVWDLRI